MTLDQVKLGSNTELVTIDSECSLRRRLMELGLTPGTRLSVVRAAPMGDPLEINVRGYNLSLRKDDASHIRCKD